MTSMTETTIPGYVAGTWTIDPVHSQVRFAVRHLGISKVRGGFASFAGAIEVAERPEDSTVAVSIDAASIDTKDQNRDEHLRSADFLDVDAFPTLDFRSTAVSGSADRWEVQGDLTVHGVTRPVVLSTGFDGVGGDPWGGQRAAFSASTELDRGDFGLTWNQTLDTGGLLVGKKVTVDLEVELVRS